MFNSIVITQNDLIRNECKQIINEIGDIHSEFYENFKQVTPKDFNLNYLFVLLSEMGPDSKEALDAVRKKLIYVPFIFYNHSLSLENIANDAENEPIRLIVGEERKKALKEVLQELKAKHWRRIPLDKFHINPAKVSERILKAIKFIEQSEVDECTSMNIARHLNISSGYFSQEFKKETGMPFRSFMQKVLNYYEESILSRGDLSAKSISRILGYSELSSFSRSFKKRQGISPTQFRKKIRA